MRLFKEVPIQTAEQAEALPEGTVAGRDYYDEGNEYHHYDCARKIEGGGWMQIGLVDDFADSLVIGWTALVPIEAEEETRIESDLPGCETEQDFRDYLDGKRDRLMRRLNTPWEPA